MEATRQDETDAEYIRWLILLGAGDGNRTRDLLITNQLLYQLSYAGARVQLL